MPLRSWPVCQSTTIQLVHLRAIIFHRKVEVRISKGPSSRFHKYKTGDVVLWFAGPHWAVTRIVGVHIFNCVAEAVTMFGAARLLPLTLGDSLEVALACYHGVDADRAATYEQSLLIDRKRRVHAFVLQPLEYFLGQVNALPTCDSPTRLVPVNHGTFMTFSDY